MKNKLICLLLAIMMLVSSMFVLSSCGDPEDPGENPGGEGNGNGNGNGNTPGGDTGNVGGDTGYNWALTDLFFQMTDNSNYQELPSGCKAYLAGEDNNAIGDIYDDVKARNLAATTVTNVYVEYDYYPDADGYGWGASIDRINVTVMSGDADAPDMYCNFVYDMVATSLLKSFANLKSTSRGKNYFSFVDRAFNGADTGEGYMYEYMTSLTLSKFKMYLLASDYFIDLIRAFFVVPVNINLLNQAVGDIDGDVDGNQTTDIADFYEMVKRGGWDYEKLAAYCAFIYSPGAMSSGGAATIDDDRIGFAISNTSGLSASGLVYTTSVKVINRDWDDQSNDYVYSYPTTNPELVQFANNLALLTQTTGFAIHSDLAAIRNRFATGHILFGGIICVGSLEYAEYQNMKKPDSVSDASNGYGFGVAPVPLYRASTGTFNGAEYEDKYLTQIHNVGRIGGISATTTKFSQCSAFLNYQSLNSTDILNNYYNVQLQYAVSDGSAHNTYMLQYIRSNVRSSFDKAFEDAIGIFFKATTGGESNANRWHGILMAANFYKTDMENTYASLYLSKETNLRSLVNQYTDLPD